SILVFRAGRGVVRRRTVDRIRYGETPRLDVAGRKSGFNLFMSAELKGKVALVTGGGRGIGRAIAHRLAAAGADVVIASRKLENLEPPARNSASLPGRIRPIACHVGRWAELENLVRQTEGQAGPIDILVNNSATNIGQGPALAVTDEMFDKIVEINVKAA